MELYHVFETMINIQIKNDDAFLQRRLKCLRYLATHKVDVGLPSSASARSKFLMAIHEHGSPVMHIPARPVIEPGLHQPETQAAMTSAMMESLTAAMAGDEAATKASLEKAGQAGADGIRAYIDSGALPGNSPMTIHGGWFRNPVSKKPVHVEGKGFDKPLVDTGELYDSFTYEVMARR